MRRQQPLSALDPNPIQPTEMSRSPCGKKRDGTTWGGDEEDLLYPQDGAVISRPWETFRLNSGPNPPKPIRDDLIGDSCPRKFMTRALLPGPCDLSAALHMTMMRAVTVTTQPAWTHSVKY